MSSQKQSVFISWTGEFGKLIALHLKEHLLKYDKLEPWVSEADISAGVPWFNETSSAMQKSAFGVVCLTPGSSKRPWVNFEAGYLFGKLSKCILINFGEKLGNPLQQIQMIDGNNQEDWINLLQEMSNTNRDMCKAWVQHKFPDFKSLLERICESPYAYLSEMDRTIGTLQDAVDSLKDNSYARENLCYQQVILEAYNEIKVQSIGVDSSYRVPASQYPLYLISLQKKLNPIVKAIALVKVKELFWQQNLGREILETSNENNIRVFVFSAVEFFEEMLDTLRHHANRYRIYAISYISLLKEFDVQYTKDFSIVNTTDSKLLAKYDNIQGQEFIHFNSDPQMVLKHERALDKIISKAVFIPSNTDLTDLTIKKQLCDRIFNPPNLAYYDTRTIEMSLYIDVEDYDKHEEKHAYFQEMMQKMIDIFIVHSSRRTEPCRVLEFGAGTGIFTKRLANQPDISKIVAIEIDWHCFNKLKSRFRKIASKIETLYEDSRTYDPEGTFNYVFSSFADHHIKISDKFQYFENVKRNLKSGGLMIVGDEFLPEYELNNKESRDIALNKYHNHIISIANEQGETVLSILEQEALDSGLREIGDFKVSCQEYEELLKKAGFKFKKEKVGPQFIDDVGGVYVYTAWLAD
jgi:cyclopropane fatty-acyl-phospholipid synthase-like methyltransferase